ncbi:myb-like protein V [Diabrotica virgifera virgifera]|uniref:Uncharacterized protein n=1 Tax=Diabrotica virgifera virgifera TaxID=50390 RepID=A0ABM5L4M7_DIAVI|nr:myb-like protein V [Diabrotica virgifera virgifera]
MDTPPTYEDPRKVVLGLLQEEQTDESEEETKEDTEMKSEEDCEEDTDTEDTENEAPSKAERKSPQRERARRAVRKVALKKLETLFEDQQDQIEKHEEETPANLHKEVCKTQVYARIKNSIKKRNKSRKVWITLTEELSKIYLDEDENLYFENQYVEELTESDSEPTSDVQGISTRSRKQSENDLVVSEHPEESSPPKRERPKKTDDAESTGRRTRSRAGSASSIKSGKYLNII